jgi:hypothetical protein
MYIFTANKTFDCEINEPSNPFEHSKLSGFDVAINDSVSLPHMIDQCNLDINSIQKRLKEVSGSLSELNSVNVEINHIKKSISEGIINNEILMISDEIKKSHIMMQNISDCLHTYASHNKAFLDDARLNSAKIHNEINGLYNLSKMFSEETKGIYRDMQEYNKQIGLSAVNSGKLMNQFHEKFAMLNDNVDNMNDLYIDHIKQIKSQNQYRLTIIIVFAVICAILVGLSIAIIVIFK